MLILRPETRRIGFKPRGCRHISEVAPLQLLRNGCNDRAAMSIEK